ncbi:MAG: hypothetical protein QOE54_1839 [Streptosporangiaceae bacterium]|nr:hypothetical protein [Streptosporangiaceae bacterium]
MADLNRRLIVARGALILLASCVNMFVGYLTRAARRAVHPKAVKASLLASGEPATRTPGTTVKETSVFDRAFNIMSRIMSRSSRHTRDELRRLAHEQAALRRVATLVACAEPPATVFAAVAREVGQVIGAEITRMLRYEPDETTTVIGVWGGPDEVLAINTRWTIAGSNLPSMVLHSNTPARMDCFIGAVSPLCVYLQQHGICSGIGTPIIVDGRCWGVMTAFSTHDQLLPRAAETRICDFTDLVATAIANTQVRADLTASRARIVAATDQARRRIGRDLHDGTQQRLVSLAMELHIAEKDVPADAPELRTRLSEVAAGLTDALNELQETARGIHPASLARGGFVQAIKGLIHRSAVPVKLDAPIETRLPESVEVAAYYVVAEALANAAKYAQASATHVKADICDGRLCLLVCDDGRGGADPARGSGLTGLADRIEALNGTIKVTSPPGQGTVLQVELPITSD